MEAHLAVGELYDLCKRACAKLCRAVSFSMRYEGGGQRTSSTSTAVLAMGGEVRPRGAWWARD